MGFPAAIVNLIKARPGLRATIEVPKPSASLVSVVKWHEWAMRFGELRGWTQWGSHYSGTNIQRNEFANYGTEEIVENWSCNIGDIEGLCASKSDLTKFANLDIIC